MEKSVASISLEVMSGTPVFAGTRVPIKVLIDYLAGGETIDTFLDEFPTVNREQVIRFLEGGGLFAITHAEIDTVGRELDAQTQA
jgi:uncharacterized protein (DUF433 family)